MSKTTLGGEKSVRNGLSCGRSRIFQILALQPRYKMDCLSTFRLLACKNSARVKICRNCYSPLKCLTIKFTSPIPSRTHTININANEDQRIWRQNYDRAVNSTYHFINSGGKETAYHKYLWNKQNSENQCSYLNAGWSLIQTKLK